MSSLPQPLMYPQPISAQPASTSRGSFGPVFIVLAVIAVLAAIACFIGRLCARRISQHNPRQNRTHAAGDMEYGFDSGIAKAKPASKGWANREDMSADIEFGFDTSGHKVKLVGKGGAKQQPSPSKSNGVGGKKGEFSPGANGMHNPSM